MVLLENENKDRNIQACLSVYPAGLTAFLFLGAARGILVKTAGFSFPWSFAMAACIFAGSLEFVAVDLMAGTFNPLQALLMAVVINARHLFYSIAMLDEYRKLGRRKIYMIYGLIDETFSLIHAAKIPSDCDRGEFMFYVTILNHIYWLTGTSLGALLGSFISFNTAGLDFVMTAMFAVVFFEQWEKDRNHLSALIGLFSAALCLIVFEPSSFMIPTMACMLILLTIAQKKTEGSENP